MSDRRRLRGARRRDAARGRREVARRATSVRRQSVRATSRRAAACTLQIKARNFAPLFTPNLPRGARCSSAPARASALPRAPPPPPECSRPHAGHCCSFRLACSRSHVFRCIPPCRLTQGRQLGSQSWMRRCYNRRRRHRQRWSHRSRRIPRIARSSTSRRLHLSPSYQRGQRCISHLTTQ